MWGDRVKVANGSTTRTKSPMRKAKTEQQVHGDSTGLSSPLRIQCCLELIRAQNFSPRLLLLT